MITLTLLCLFYKLGDESKKVKNTFENDVLEWAACCLVDAIWYLVLFKI